MGGISSILQILALIGLLLGFAGIALVVTASTQNRSPRNGVLLAIIGFILGGVMLVVSQGVLVVQSNERAVVFNNLSGQLEEPRRPGVSIIIPGIQQVFMYPAGLQNYTFSRNPNEGARTASDAIQARSIDGQQVTFDMSVIFRLQDDAASLNQLHIDWANQPGGYTEGLIRPIVTNTALEIVSEFAAEDIYGARRDELRDLIRTNLIEVLPPFGVDVTEVTINDIQFSQQFLDAVERKQIEEQELQRATTAADRAKTEAEGRAEAQIAEANGDAEAIKLRAAAEAEALRLVSAELAANPSLIQYTYVQNLSDNISVMLVPSNSPFLLDGSTLMPTAPQPAPEATPSSP